MKKLIIGCCIFCFVAVQAFAQIPTFTQGEQLAGVAIGLGGHSFGTGYSSTPYITGYFEKCVKGDLFDDKSSLGIGGTVGFKQTTYKYSTWGWNYTYLLFGLRGVLHYAFVDKLDTYGGLMLGYRVASSKEIGTPVGTATNYNNLNLDLFLGGRYYFNDKFAIFLELGYSWFSNANIGVSIKL